MKRFNIGVFVLLLLTTLATNAQVKETTDKLHVEKIKKDSNFLFVKAKAVQVKIMNPIYSYQNGGDWTWFGARMIQQLIKLWFFSRSL